MTIYSKKAGISVTVFVRLRWKRIGQRAAVQGLRTKDSHRRVLVTCDCDNAASRAVILANGGALEDIRELVKRRYWIG